MFLEDEKAADEYILTIMRALEANSQSQAVRTAMLEGMPALLDCFESRGDEVGRLAGAIVTELEKGVSEGDQDPIKSMRNPIRDNCQGEWNPPGRRGNVD
jgi:hypothetical protein